MSWVWIKPIKEEETPYWNKREIFVVVDICLSFFKRILFELGSYINFFFVRRERSREFKRNIDDLILFFNFGFQYLVRAQVRSGNRCVYVSSIVSIICALRSYWKLINFKEKESNHIFDSAHINWHQNFRVIRL